MMILLRHLCLYLSVDEPDIPQPDDEPDEDGDPSNVKPDVVDPMMDPVHLNRNR